MTSSRDCPLSALLDERGMLLPSLIQAGRQQHHPIQSRPTPQLSVFLHIGPGRLTTSSGLQQLYKLTKWNCKGLLSLLKHTNGYHYGKMWDIFTNSWARNFKIKISFGLENPLCYWRGRGTADILVFQVMLSLVGTLKVFVLISMWRNLG